MKDQVWHFEFCGPGRTRCGNYGPNEGTTTIRKHVTCEACIKPKPS